MEVSVLLLRGGGVGELLAVVAMMQRCLGS